ncbi:MAG: family acetyltransferase [Frankiales bacterium]|nr:family acetyltransferase [Frankiales bacterium]
MSVEELHEERTAGAVLGRAFLEDPVFGWLVQGADRERRLIRAFTAFAGTAVRTPGSRVLVTAERTAAALWLPPGGWRGGLVELLRTAAPLAGALRTGTLRGLRLQAVVERQHLRRPHWYLEALGAVPEARGTGVGRRVVQPVLDACDDAGLPAYLESSNPRNWSFYERLGFVRGEPLPVPAGCPLLVPMTRRPR